MHEVCVLHELSPTPQRRRI